MNILCHAGIRLSPICEVCRPRSSKPNSAFRTIHTSAAIALRVKFEDILVLEDFSKLPKKAIHGLEITYALLQSAKFTAVFD